MSVNIVPLKPSINHDALRLWPARLVKFNQESRVGTRVTFLTLWITRLKLNFHVDLVLHGNVHGL